MRAQTWVGLGVVLSGLCGPLVHAQEDPAREHFRRGEAAYQKGNYTLAIEEWQAAFTTDPRPRIQYNIYQAYERLGQLSEASAALQRYLSTADPDDPSYSDATARMSALQQRLQSTGIRLSGGVEGASINVSGHDWGRMPRPDRIPVQPGNHRVVIRLDGYRDFMANVVVPPGQVVEVPVQLESLAGESDAPSPSASKLGASTGSTSPARDEGGDDATPFFIASAVLGAGAIGSLVWTINRASELDGCDSVRNYCPEESTVKGQRNIALGLTIVLGAGAVGTLVYGLLLGGGDDESAAACVPAVGGATCTVRF